MSRPLLLCPPRRSGVRSASSERGGSWCLHGFVAWRRVQMGITRSHRATSQQPQLEHPRQPDHEYCRGTQQCGKQQIEAEGNTPMNP